MPGAGDDHKHPFFRLNLSSINYEEAFFHYP
jgi:hypothetical protein